MNDPQELKALLSQHYGSEEYTRNPLYPWMLATSGVKTFAENAGGGAYWLLDIIGTEMRNIDPFLVITLRVCGTSALLTASTDSTEPPVYSKEISFTDCPAGEWKFYLSGNVLMLPSEY